MQRPDQIGLTTSLSIKDGQLVEKIKSCKFFWESGEDISLTYEDDNMARPELSEEDLTAIASRARFILLELGQEEKTYGYELKDNIVSDKERLTKYVFQEEAFSLDR